MLFTEDQMEAAPVIQAFSMLPSIQYVGEMGWSRASDPSPLVIDRTILAEGCFAMPIAEAMIDVGIDSPSPVLLEDFDGPNAPRQLVEAGALDSTEFWSALALGDSDVQIDCNVVGAISHTKWPPTPQATIAIIARGLVSHG
jgi:hypothetical protein